MTTGRINQVSIEMAFASPSGVAEISLTILFLCVVITPVIASTAKSSFHQ
jgi:hypothetical protein